MSREILILDVTEMSGQNVCIAGIDLKTREQVRLSTPQPTRTTVRMLSNLMPTDVLRTDWERDRRALRPHVEDGRWNRLTARNARETPFEEVVKLLEQHAFDSVEEAFGAPWLKSRKGNHAWEPRRGDRSLATIRVKYVRFERDREDRVRADFRDLEDAYWKAVPFQDLEVKRHAAECEDCATRHLENVRDDFAANRCLIRVGITRPFAQEQHPAACWLQVTNIFARTSNHF